MIVDCYTHIWESPDQLGRCVPRAAPVGSGETEATRRGDAMVHPAGISRHQVAAEPVDVTFILGFQSRYLEAAIPNDEVASYVRPNAERLIGFAAVDPSEPKAAIDELVRARDELAMPGAAVAPAAQDFHPTSSQAMLVYAKAAELGMPLIFHTGVYVAPATKLEYARPVLLDEVAREFPELKFVIAHLGYPWVDETVMLLAKHRHVYAETSWLLSHSWRAYQALLLAWQQGVMGKLLFGSGFPAATAADCIESIYSVNQLVHGTNLPSIPRDQLRGIVERDALALLGLSRPCVSQSLQTAGAAVAEDEHED